LSGGVNVPEGRQVTIRGVDEHRPIVLLNGDFQINGGNEAEFELNGLLISGGELHIPAGCNQLHTLRLVHCTLAPSSNEIIQSPPPSGDSAGIRVESLGVHVEIEHSIV